MQNYCDKFVCSNPVLRLLEYNDLQIYLKIYIYLLYLFTFIIDLYCRIS